MTDEFESFRQSKESGDSASACCLAAQQAGLGAIETVRMLREVFSLSIEQAKEVLITADGRWESLDQYQEAVLLPALEEAFRRAPDVD